MRNLAWFLLFIAVMLFFIGYFTVGYMGHNTCGMCG